MLGQQIVGSILAQNRADLKLFSKSQTRSSTSGIERIPPSIIGAGRIDQPRQFGRETEWHRLSFDSNQGLIGCEAISLASPVCGRAKRVSREKGEVRAEVPFDIGTKAISRFSPTVGTGEIVGTSAEC